MAEYKINYTQSNFTGGIIAAELYGRNDFNKVKTGLKKCTNWTIREAGGLEFRRGTKYLQTVPVAAGSNFKIASIDDTIILFCNDGVRYLDTNNEWQLLSYPTGVTPDLSQLHFTELKRRLYFYDGAIKLCEVVLNNGVPSVAISLFESEPTGATLSSAISGTQPEVYVAVVHKYTFSLAKDEEHETVVSGLITEQTANAELTQANSSDNRGQQINVTIGLTVDQATEYDGGKILIYKEYQGYFYFLAALDIQHKLSGADNKIYVRDSANDTATSLAWNCENTTYYTSGVSEPEVNDSIYSDSACTTSVTTISKKDSFTFEDKGQVTVDMSKTPKTNPDYLLPDGSIEGVNSIADYNQRLFFTQSGQDVTRIIFSEVGNTESLAYSTQRNENEAGNLELPISHYDSWCKVASGLDLILSTSYTISKVSGYGDLTTETVLWDGLSKTVDPVRTRRSLIYTNTSNRNIYDLTYNEYGQYDSIDLTLLVKYIFEEKTIKKLAFKDYPVKTIYVLCDDGDLYCLTYIKDQNIYAWYKIEHEGTIVDVCVVNIDTEDEVYLVVNYDGSYIVERAYHRTDTVYLDCCITKQTTDITADNKITGLDIFEGKKVRVFDTGNNFYYGDYDIMNPKTIVEGGRTVEIDDLDFNGLLVENGEIQLPDDTEFIGPLLIGLPYYAVAETIPLEFQDSNGNSTIGRKKAVNEAYLRYGDSRGVTYKTMGHEYDCGICERDVADNAQFLERGQVKLHTVSEYKWDSTIKILQRQPYPARIESITLGLTFNDKS